MHTREKRTEIVSEWCQEANFAEEGVIKDVLLCGNTSRNGYGIPAKAFGTDARAKALYEDKMIFFNHNPQQPLHRNVQTEFAGVIRNVRLRDGRPRGDIDTRHAPAGKSLWAISQISPQPKGLGLSHVAEYRFTESREEVEEVAQVVSVDVVMTPATTNTLYEQVSTVDFETELKTVRAERDNNAAELKTTKERLVSLEQAEKALKEAVETLTAEAAALKTSEATLKAQVDQYAMERAVAERRASIEVALKAAGLDPADKAVVTEVFLEQLVKCADESARKSLIEDRASLAAKAGSTTPGASERKSGEQAQAFDLEAFLKNIPN